MSSPHFTSPDHTSLSASPSSADVIKPSPSEATQFLTSLLDRPLRLTLKDLRTVIGCLYLVDGAGNVILSEAEEFPPPPPHMLAQEKGLPVDEEEKKGWERWERWRPRSEPFGGPGTGWGGRGLGLVMVKMKDFTKVELMDDQEEGAQIPQQG